MRFFPLLLSSSCSGASFVLCFSWSVSCVESAVDPGIEAVALSTSAVITGLAANTLENLEVLLDSAPGGTLFTLWCV